MQHSKTGNFYTIVNINNQSSISRSLKVVDPLREKFELFSPLGFDIKRSFDQETYKSTAPFNQSIKTIFKPRKI